MHKLTCGKRDRELATTLDGKSTSTGIAGPYTRQKLKARTGGEKGRHLWPQLVQKLQSKRVNKKYTSTYIEPAPPGDDRAPSPVQRSFYISKS